MTFLLYWKIYVHLVQGVRSLLRMCQTLCQVQRSTLMDHENIRELDARQIITKKKYEERGWGVILRSLSITLER